MLGDVHLSRRSARPGRGRAGVSISQHEPGGDCRNSKTNYAYLGRRTRPGAAIGWEVGHRRQPAVQEGHDLMGRVAIQR